MSSPSQVRRGPLEAFAPGFADELRGLGYTPVAVVFQLQLMAHASRWMGVAGFGPAALPRAVRAAAALPQPGTPAELLERFGEYLTIERGLAAGIVVDYVHRCARSWLRSAATVSWICSGCRPRMSRRSWLLAVRASRAARRR